MGKINRTHRYLSKNAKNPLNFINRLKLICAMINTANSPYSNIKLSNLILFFDKVIEFNFYTNILI